MSINRDDSRHRIKRTLIPGTTPTVPGTASSADFTDGTWLPSDVRDGEFYLNIPDKRLWIGASGSFLELSQIGSTTSGNSLSQTLAIGNDTDTYNIIMGTATQIESSNGGAYLSLDNNVIKLISNSGDQQLWLENGYASLADWSSGGYAELATNGGYIKVSEGTGFFGYYHMILSGDVEYLSGKPQNASAYPNPTAILIAKCDTNDLQSSASSDYMAIMINSYNSSQIIAGSLGSTIISANAGYINGTYSAVIGGASNNVTADNTVVLGGSSISGSQSNMVYVPNLYVNNGSVYNTSLITNGSAFGYSSYMLIDTFNSGIYVNSNNGFVISGTGTNNYVYSRWFHNTESVTNSTAATTTIKSILPPVNMNFTIEAIVTAYSSNKAYSAKLFAVFRNDSGTITQVGTTDVTAKDDFSDGTAATIDTNGTIVRIRITNGSGLLTQWTTRYSYNS